MLTAGVALYRAWSQANGQGGRLCQPVQLGQIHRLDCCWQHTACRCCAAGARVAKSLCEAVQKRTGAMAAVIGLDDDKIEAGGASGDRNWSCD